MGDDSSSRLTPLYASSEAMEAVAHAALHNSITDVLAESVAEKAPHYVRSALESLRAAYDAVAMSIECATQDVPGCGDGLERTISAAASAEYGYFAAVTRWRGEWLAMLRAAGDSVVTVPLSSAPPPSEFLAVCGEALACAFPVEPWGALPQHVMGAIKELTRGYLEVAQSLRAITLERGQPSPEALANAAKVLADMSETELATMGVMIAWRLHWLYKWRRIHTEGAASTPSACQK